MNLLHSLLGHSIRIATRLRHLVARRGIRETARVVLHYPANRWSEYREGWFDRIYGTDTGKWIDPEDLGATSENVAFAVAYQATPTAHVLPILRDLALPFPDTTFVDLGSGKGRVLMMASQKPWKRLVGVEFSPGLHAIAMKNITKFLDKTRQEDRFELCLTDAANFQVPSGNLFFYLFNPFKEEVLAKVIANIGRAYQAERRAIHILYVRPICAQVLDAAPFLGLVTATPAYRFYVCK